MSAERSTYWRQRIDALHDEIREHRRMSRYDRANDAQQRLRAAYDEWALEIDFGNAA